MTVFWNIRPLTSVTNYQHSLPNSPEERSSHNGDVSPKYSTLIWWDRLQKQFLPLLCQNENRSSFWNILELRKSSKTTNKCQDTIIHRIRVIFDFRVIFLVTGVNCEYDQRLYYTVPQIFRNEDTNYNTTAHHHNCSDYAVRCWYSDQHGSPSEFQ
jgi:hypothetical protein